MVYKIYKTHTQCPNETLLTSLTVPSSKETQVKAFFKGGGGIPVLWGQYCTLLCSMVRNAMPMGREKRNGRVPEVKDTSVLKGEVTCTEKKLFQAREATYVKGGMKSNSTTILRGTETCCSITVPSTRLWEEVCHTVQSFTSMLEARTRFYLTFYHLQYLFNAH